MVYMSSILGSRRPAHEPHIPHYLYAARPHMRTRTRTRTHTYWLSLVWNSGGHDRGLRGACTTIPIWVQPPGLNEQIESITTTWHGAGKGVLAPGVFALCFIRHDLERAHLQSFRGTALYTVLGQRVGHRFDTRRAACRRRHRSAHMTRSLPPGRSLRKCYGSSSGGCLRSQESVSLRVIEGRRVWLQRA